MSTHKTVSEVFHTLVKRVKTNKRFSHVRFLKTSGNRNAEKPVTGYLALCGVREIRWQECFLYESKRGDTIGKYSLVGEVLAVGKKRSSMYELQRLCDDLAEAFAMADKEGFVVSCQVDGGYFDQDMDALCQRVAVNMEIYAKKGEEGSS